MCRMRGAMGTSHPSAAGMRGGGASVPWWNAFSLMIFLCWFGAAGYLLSRYGSFVALIVLVLAVVCGLAGGAIVFFFLTKVLLPHERELTADETEVIGAVGHLSSAIRVWRHRRDCVRTTGRAAIGAGAIRRRRTDSKTGRGLCRALRKRRCVCKALGRSARGRSGVRIQRSGVGCILIGSLSYCPTHPMFLCPLTTCIHH